jgi:hypothetical protein
VIGRFNRGSGAPFDGPGYTGTALSADCDTQDASPADDAEGVFAVFPRFPAINEPAITRENKAGMTLTAGGRRGSRGCSASSPLRPTRPPNAATPAIVNMMAAANTAMKLHPLRTK